MVVYTYKNKNEEVNKIEVELAKHDFIPIWINYLERISKKTPNTEWYVAVANKVNKPVKPNILIPYLKKLLEIYNFFNNHKVNNFDEIIYLLTELVTCPEKTEQKHLNTFHRHFTLLEMEYLKQGKSLPLGIDFKKFWLAIQELNTYTHKLECYTYGKSVRRQKYKDQLQYSIQFTNAHNLAYSKTEQSIFSDKNIEYINNCKFDFFSQNYDYDVWLHEDITGKDQMKAFLEEDDLKEFDVTGNILFTPSVLFDPFKIYKNVLDDKLFRKESKDASKTLDRYPIGNIINKNNIIWSNLLESKIMSIHLNNNLLWETKW